MEQAPMGRAPFWPITIEGKVGIGAFALSLLPWVPIAREVQASPYLIPVLWLAALVLTGVARFAKHDHSISVLVAFAVSALATLAVLAVVAAAVFMPSTGAGAIAALVILGPLVAGLWTLAKKGSSWPVRCLAAAGVVLLGGFFLYAAQTGDFPPGHVKPGFERDCGSLLAPSGPCQALRDRVPLAASLAALGVGLITAAFSISSTSQPRNPFLVRARALGIGLAAGWLTWLVMHSALLSDINSDRN